MTKNRVVALFALWGTLPAVALALPTLPALPTQLPTAPAPTQLPTGGQVGAGNATISQTGNRLDVVQGSDKAIINWQTFSIGSQGQVVFTQPSSQSAVLNRVISAEPSALYGSMSANGRVYLINPNGIVFGPGGQINVGGLVLSTTAMTDGDFLAGVDRFAPVTTGSAAVDIAPVSPGLAIETGDRHIVSGSSLHLSTSSGPMLGSWGATGGSLSLTGGVTPAISSSGVTSGPSAGGATSGNVWVINPGGIVNAGTSGKAATQLGLSTNSASSKGGAKVTIADRRPATGNAGLARASRFGAAIAAGISAATAASANDRLLDGGVALRFDLISGLPH